MWDLLYPRRCAICDGVLRRKEIHVCEICMLLPQRIGEKCCLRCGKPLEREDTLCTQCMEGTHTFLAGRSAFVYDRYMRRSITNFKYHGRQEYAAYYAEVLYEMYGKEIEKLGADALIPVPVHKERLKKRGYNQAEVLAKYVSEKTGIPVYGEYLVRTRKTAPQKELSGKERLKNLSQAFSVNMKVWELSKWINCVIIIDDIYTTGSTIEACSRVLKPLGIEKIYFLCVCTGQGD